MTRVLIISPAPTHPTRAGNRARILNMAEQFLARGISVSFLYLGREGLDPESLAEMHRYFAEFWYVEPMREARIPADQIATAVYSIDDWMTPDLVMAVSAFTKGKRFDAVVVNYVMYSRLLDLFGSDTVKVLDTHDRMGGRHELLDAAGIARNFFWTTPEEEAKALKRADIVLAIQEEEASYFEALGAKLVLTLGHKPMRVASPPAEPARKELVFGAIGSDNAINRQYFSEMLRDWPADGPRLRIAGAVCRFFFGQAGNIELLGSVEDLGAFYASVDVILNPIAMGTGLKIKTLEALGYGKPLVSTLEGMRGLEASAEAHRCQDAAAVVAFALKIARDDAALAATKAASAQAFSAYVRSYDLALGSFLKASRLRPDGAKAQPRPILPKVSATGAAGGVWTGAFPSSGGPHPVAGDPQASAPAKPADSPMTPPRSAPPPPLPAGGGVGAGPTAGAPSSNAVAKDEAKSPTSAAGIPLPPLSEKLPGDSLLASLLLTLDPDQDKKKITLVQNSTRTSLELAQISANHYLASALIQPQYALVLDGGDASKPPIEANLIAVAGDLSETSEKVPFPTLVRAKRLQPSIKKSCLFDTVDLSMLVVSINNMCLDSSVAETSEYRIQVRLKGADRKTRHSLVVQLPPTVRPGETLIAVPVPKPLRKSLSEEIHFIYIDFVDRLGRGLRAGMDEALPGRPPAKA